MKWRKITETHIDAINDFVKSVQNQPITIRKIKKKLWTSYTQFQY